MDGFIGSTYDYEYLVTLPVYYGNFEQYFTMRCLNDGVYIAPLSRINFITKR